MTENTEIEYISPQLKLVVSRAHTFGTDALLLASFAISTKKRKVCDLGCGCGIIPFYWYKKNSADQIFAVDIQQKAISQLEESLEINNIEPQRIIPIRADLKNLKGVVDFGTFDLVTMNPPYTKVGAGIISDSDVDKIARHETECTFDDICRTAKKMLKFGGTLCMCIRPERLVELFISMKIAKIEPKRLRFVSQRVGKEPWLCLVEGKSGGKSGLRVEKEMYIYENDTESDEMLEILGDYRKK